MGTNRKIFDKPLFRKDSEMYKFNKTGSKQLFHIYQKIQMQ